MRNNKKYNEKVDPKNKEERRSRSSGKRGNRSRQSSRGKGKSKEEEVEKLDTSRSNNPAWYYFDEKLADQVSQMSFQQLAGYPLEYDGKAFDVPNIVKIFLNPSPGVQTSAYYNTPLAQNSGMNMAGFRLYSKLSAFTGRVQSYAPQDVSTMLLAMGEVISITETIRRAFGVAYTMNMRNRDYPRQVLEFGMSIDATDFFEHLSDYRTQFNTLITLINQLPIPKSCAYFDKCASIYERLYLDSPSAMAQTLIPMPATTWILDESTYSGGTILVTTQAWQQINGANVGVQHMSVYLNLLASMVGALLNSTTLTTVYTDLLNYASKMKCEFWTMDYLFETYQVVPEYDMNFMLQMHNATLVGYPRESVLVTGPYNVTPFNDVYPDPNRNCIYYNPAFPTIMTGNTTPRTGNSVLIDMMNDEPNLTDRVEVTRYASIAKGQSYTTTTTILCTIDTALPDHYIASIQFEKLTNNLSHSGNFSGTLCPTANFPDLASWVANIDWAPRFWEIDANGAYTGRYTGDINFYTCVDEHYLRKLHDFVGLALYDIRV